MKQKFKQIVAWIFGLGLLINAIILWPQPIKILQTHNAENVSLLTFGFFFLMQMVAGLHGYFQKDKALMIGMFFSMIPSGLTSLLIIFYG